jgi:multidrug efflux pump subunit AcrA (membrane-fusion protein)
MSRLSKTLRALWRLLGLLVVAGVLVALGLLGWHWLSAPKTEAAAEPPTALAVKVIQPRLDPSFRMTVSQPCFIEPYYAVDLEAQVPGRVLKLQKAIGNEVKAGEEVLTIDVPDLVADVAKKEAIIKQRKQELAVAGAMLEVADANVDIANKAVKEKEALVKSADAETDFRKQEYERFTELAGRGTVTPNIVKERQKYWEAAAAASLAAVASLEKAKADVVGARARVKQVKADIEYQKELVKVAERDLDVAKARLDFATLRSPCDGKITRRFVDPGSFVQSSATGHSEPLLRIERSDIVTIYTNLPDSYAEFITPDTEADIEVTELPGPTIQGKVSRNSGSLITPSNDRTLRVEVDLWNRSADEYRKFVEEETANGGKGLKGGVLPLLPLARSRHDPKKELPAPPSLTPGMYGRMRLVLKKFQNAYLIPSSAIYSQGGSPYLYLAEKNVARLVPIDVQVDDGKLAKVSLEETVNGADVKRDLTDKDVIVASNQGELSDGQPVKPAASAW